MKYLLISCGCAECYSIGDDPLIEARLYNTLEEAKASSWIQKDTWKDHPQGGWYVTSGQGDDWIIEVPDTFIIKAKE